MRHFLPSLLFLLTSTFLLSAERPNFVFLIADDLGAADLDSVPTPQLDQLRTAGVELQRHYVAPVCSPTRAGLLTGCYWSRFGITTPINNRGLEFDTPTLASVLRKAGYTTALVGKWHLGSKPEWGPKHYGFDHSYGSLAGGIAPYNHKYKKGPYSTTWHRNGELIEEEGHVTDLLANEAVQWIERQAAKGATERQPFFLYVPFTAVHLPIREPDEWLAKVPETITGEVPRQYAACIQHLDDAVGRIVAAVDKAGQKDHTLIVFTSDNGGSTAENNDTKYPDDNCPNGRLPGNNKPFRGRKGTLYEGGIRVPTFVRWPGKVKPKSAQAAPTCIVDWMPTFCALAKAKTDPEKLQWDGVNLAPLLRNEMATPPPRELHITGVRGSSWALIDGHWKLIVFKEKDQQRSVLYNLQRDPEETTNLANKHPEKTAALQAKLAAQRKRDIPSRGGL